MELEELSKIELLNLIYNNFDVKYNCKVACAACSTLGVQEYYYICDRCNCKEKTCY